MATHYESLKLLGDRLLRNNVMKGISWDFIIDSTIDFMDIVGVPEIYEDKLYEGTIEEYRVELPCGFIEENFVKIDGVPAMAASDPMHTHYNKVGSNTVHTTYSVNNSYLFASKEKGKIQIAYKAIMQDSEGYPMMPSNRIFISALEWFIKAAYFTMLWEDGKIEDKRLHNAQQEYAWAVGRLESDSNRLSLGRAELLLHSLRTLVPRENEFSQSFTHK